MKKLKSFGIVLAFLVIITGGIGLNAKETFAAGSDVVYITKSGECYHNGNCSSLRKSKTATTVDAAIAAGKRPCSKCNPPTGTNAVTNNSVKNQTSAVSGGNDMVWLSETGTKYHRINNCGKMNPNKARQVTEEYAISHGYGKCSKCCK